jgi:hypothetical protein
VTEGLHAVHGIGRELTKPDRPPLTDGEVSAVLGGRNPGPMRAGPW